MDSEEISHPMIVGPTDFGLSTMDKNQAFLRKVLKDSRTRLVYSIDAGAGNLYAMQTAQGGYVFAVDQENVVRYLVQYKLKKLLGKLAVRQVMLWRDPDSRIAGGLTSFVFYNLLLPVTGVIAADREQTEKGQEFWRRRLSESLGSPHRYLYLVDQGRRTFEPIQTERELRAIVNRVWGVEQKHLDLIPVITNRIM